MNNSLRIGLKGTAMGMAEVVPGVSGGTIAFITGIYERLINAIKAITGLPFGGLKGKSWQQVWAHIDGTFLLTLGTGMVGGILIGIFGISYLLEHYPAMVWGFFFGLIIGSAIYVGRTIAQWTTKEIVALIIGIAIAYYITIVSPVEATHSYPFIFISGMIAISALILPGISGSFILLLLGMYTFVLHSIKDVLLTQNTTSMLIMGVFIVGCLAGVAVFSNVLSWTLKKYRYPTLALLTGFMIGSLNRIWPWRNPALWVNDETGAHLSVLPLNADMEDFHVLQELNVLPINFEGAPHVLGTILCALTGLALVYFLSSNEQKT